MQQLTRQKVLNLIKEAVKFSPLSLGNSRPNTYAVINSISDFNTPNLGYTSQDLTVDAWTRKQQTVNNFELAFPMVCPILREGSIEFSIDNTKFKTLNDTIQILFVDRYFDQKDSKSAAEKRSKTQIINDVEKGVLKVLEYLQAVQPYKVQVTAGVYVEDYFTKEYLDEAITQSKILSYQGYQDFSPLLKSHNDYQWFLKKNLNLRKSILEYTPTNHEIVGIFVTLNVQSYSCDNSDFDYFIEGDKFGENQTTYLGK